MLGLSASTTKGDIVRATLEGVCLELRWIIDEAKKLGTDIEEVRIWGGAAKSPLWNQIAADIYGVPAAMTEVPDAGLVGAAICAGIGIGMFENAQEGSEAMVRVVERYEPDSSKAAKYDEIFAIYKDTYDVLVNGKIFERMAAL
jgi:xylulokinase